MNHAWVLGGFPLPNSAVPVLPNVPGGRPAPAAVPLPCTTLAMKSRSVTAVAGASERAGGALVTGSVGNVGACQVPGAGVPAVSPAVSSAVEVITLNVEPGGYEPSSAREKPLSGFETKARI